MQKRKFFAILAILIIIPLISLSAQCGVDTEDKIDVLEGETDIDETPTGNDGKDTTGSEKTDGADSEEEEVEADSEGDDTYIDKEGPAITLEIYDGPIYSAADEVCYYRIEAKVTGNPSPTVTWSKDDSSGAWGSKKAQINLYSPSETYTLIATATNTEDSATDSITLDWGCEEEPPGGEAGGDGEGFEPPEWEGREIFDFSEMTFNPFDIGYVVFPTGVNTTELIIGDSISNTDVRGFFAFDLISLSGKQILDATLTVTTYKYYPNPGFKGEIFIGLCNYLPLDPSDYEYFVNVIHYYPNTSNPLVISKKSLRYPVQEIVNDSCILGFRVWYEKQDTDWDHEIDGREYSKDSISLTIRYVD